MEQDLKEKTVGTWVVENIENAHVFLKYDIDFCCGGGISIEKAALKNQVDIDSLLNDLAKNNLHNNPTTNYDEMELNQLTQYIEQKHHTFIRETIPMGLHYGEKVCSVHGEKFPVLFEIHKLFQQIADELLGHLPKEEQILFPYIKYLLETKNTHASFHEPNFKRIINPLKVMEAEHEEAGELIKKIKELTFDFTSPDWACNTLKAYYNLLQLFHNDLLIHVHLENNILFPKTKQLELSIANP